MSKASSMKMINNAHVIDLNQFIKNPEEDIYLKIGDNYLLFQIRDGIPGDPDGNPYIDIFTCDHDMKPVKAIVDVCDGNDSQLENSQVILGWDITK